MRRRDPEALQQFLWFPGAGNLANGKAVDREPALSDRFRNDPEWASFRSRPEAFGFAAMAVPDTNAILYIKQGLIGGAVSSTGRVSS